MGAPTSSRLTGRVAVGIVIVEGPTADLKFTAAERTKVVAEVQNGLTWLGSQSSPGGISWSYDIRIVTLTTKPNAADASLAQKEARWRDPAMQQLGFATGMAGVQAYVNGLRTRLNTDWAYCAFFVKYPVGHFAYASLGGPRLVMHYANDGWGPDNIDRVFAHESGHIFGAPDEYSSSGCSCSPDVRPVQRAEQQLPVVCPGRRRLVHHALQRVVDVPVHAVPPRIPPGRLTAAGGRHLRRQAAQTPATSWTRSSPPATTSRW